MELDTITQSKVTQTQKDKYYIFPLIHGRYI